MVNPPVACVACARVGFFCRAVFSGMVQSVPASLPSLSRRCPLRPPTVGDPVGEPFGSNLRGAKGETDRR